MTASLFISLDVQLMKYGFVILLLDDYVMSQTSCNPEDDVVVQGTYFSS